jgi:acetyl esterase/lipase
VSAAEITCSPDVSTRHGRAASRTWSWRGILIAVVAAWLAAYLALNSVDLRGAPSVAAPPRDASGVAYGPRPEQLLDVHLPPGTGPFPVVVFAHAGGWIGGGREVIPDVIRTLVPDLGVAVVSIDYRLVGKAADGTYTNTFPSASYDMDRAIRFVRANAARWNLDPDHLVAAGASAGGQLAALAGVAPGTFTDPTLPTDLAQVSPRVQGVIDYVGPSDFRTFAQAGGWAPALTAGLLGCAPAWPETCDPARMAAASVATHLSPTAPPAYLAYGEQDSLVLSTTQGSPLAAAWAQQRGDLSQPDPSLRGVWYEQQTDADHNFDRSNSDYTAMERWLRLVVADTLR